MDTKVLIVAPNAEEHADIIRERLPEYVQNGKISLMLARDENYYKLEDIQDVNIIGTYYLENHIPNLRKLKWVMTFSSGFDHWEDAALLSPEIPLVHVPGGSGVTVAEFIIGMMLNRVKKYDRYLANQHEYHFERIRGGELYGKILGIIGLGGIDRELARKAKAFDMRVIGSKVRPENVPYVDKVYHLNPLITAH